MQAGGSTSEGSARTRVIAGPDDLYQYELRQCFDILHACGQATQKYASLATTRKSIEGFLTAIFNGFDGADEKPPDKPEMSFSVEASAPVGRICGTFGPFPSPLLPSYVVSRNPTHREEDPT